MVHLYYARHERASRRRKAQGRLEWAQALWWRGLDRIDLPGAIPKVHGSRTCNLACAQDGNAVIVCLDEPNVGEVAVLAHVMEPVSARRPVPGRERRQRLQSGIFLLGV
jgi:hypothetical protein